MEVQRRLTMLCAQTEMDGFDHQAQTILCCNVAGDGLIQVSIAPRYYAHVLSKCCRDFSWIPYTHMCVRHVGMMMIPEHLPTHRRCKRFEALEHSVLT